MRPFLIRFPEGWRLQGIPSYGAMLGLGFLCAYFLVRRNSRRIGLKEGILEDIWVLAIIGGIVGARLWHIIQYPEDKLSSLIFFWRNEGITGLVFYGGVIGAVLGTLIYLKKIRKVAVLPCYDALIPGVALGLAFGRIGCFLASCCWGRTCNLPWAVRFPAGSGAFCEHVEKGWIDVNSTLSLPVHPAQLYAVVAALAVFVMLQWFFKRRKHDGEALWLFLIIYPPVRFVLEAFRANDFANSPKIVFGMFSPAQVMSFFAFFMGLALFTIGRKYNLGALTTIVVDTGEAKDARSSGSGKSEKKKKVP